MAPRSPKGTSEPYLAMRSSLPVVSAKPTTGRPAARASRTTAGTGSSREPSRHRSEVLGGIRRDLGAVEALGMNAAALRRGAGQGTKLVPDERGREDDEIAFLHDSLCLCQQPVVLDDPGQFMHQRYQLHAGALDLRYHLA